MPLLKDRQHVKELRAAIGVARLECQAIELFKFLYEVKRLEKLQPRLGELRWFEEVKKGIHHLGDLLSSHVV